MCIHYYYLHISSIVGSEEYGEPHHQPPQEFPWSGFGTAEETGYCWESQKLGRVCISIISSIWLNKTWRESWNWRPTDATDITTSRDPYLGNPLPVFLSQLTNVSSHKCQKQCAPQNFSCFSLLNSSHVSCIARQGTSSQYQSTIVRRN